MKTAICIASGPSLTKEDVEYCQGKGTIYAVKEAILLAPWADVMYAADTDYWHDYQERWSEFKGKKVTCCKKSADKFNLDHVQVVGTKSFQWSLTPGKLASGGNSGFQALNMAVLDGADRVILLGYDYGYDPKKDNKHWWEETHPRTSRDSNYKEWNKRLNKASKFIPVPVINASRATAINCFKKMTIQEALK